MITHSSLDFIPADYTPFKKTSGYMKFSQGENKIRILSKPISGIEEWVNNKPKRSLNNKNFVVDPNGKQDPKEFWSFIVYNYVEKAIQILNLTQQTILKSIKALSKDPDWGHPYFYDIKITKHGSAKEDTEYLVNPLPHKPLSEEIVRAFNDKPINLMALYTNDDPFSHLQDSYTPGVFKRDAEIELQPIQEVVLIESKLNPHQVEELTNVLTKCEDSYKKKVWNFWKKEYKINSLADLPSHLYESILSGAINNSFELATKEVQEEGQ